jgi:hypothetical protein
MNDTQPTTPSFTTWGLLELMGHQRLAGQISETTIAGTGMIRIDVPTIGDIMGYTRFFSPGALYGITPTTEQIATMLAIKLQAKPISQYELPALQQLKLDADESEW